MTHPQTLILDIEKSAHTETAGLDAETQNTLDERNESDDRSGTTENDVFDHKARNALLQNGKFNAPSGTIFEAIFQELKARAQVK